MKKLKKIVKHLSSLLLLCVCSCGSQHPELTVYVSADEYVARQVFQAFTEETGIQVRWVGDTESTKTTHIVQRLLREREHPLADVFWSSEILGTIQLAHQDLLAPCQTEITTAWPDQYKSESLHWFGFSPRARVIAFDPTQTPVDALPVYWWEYTDAAFADPRFGTTGTHLAVMSKFDNKFKNFIQSMQTSPKLGGNAATVQAVIDGQVKFAMTDSDDVYAARANGAQIELHMPRHHDEVGGGTLFIPNTVAMMKGCNNPELAQAFIEFMLSDTLAILLAESPSKNYPIQKHIADLYPNLTVEDPLVVDFETVALYKDQVIQACMMSFGQNGE